MAEQKPSSASTPDLTLEELAAHLAPGDRLLGLDLGTRTIGVALSDSQRIVATPLEGLSKGKFKTDMARLAELIAEHQVGGVIVGLPLNLDGSEGPRAQSARAFVRNFSGASDCPVVFWDERLSTVAVERTLLEADTSRKRRGEVVDKMAAAYILQGALDRLKNIGT